MRKLNKISLLSTVAFAVFSFAITSSCVKGTEPGRLDDRFVEAFRGEHLEPIAVKGASYLLLPDNHDGKTFLSSGHNGTLKFSQDINRQSLFSFAEVGRTERIGDMPHRFYLTNLDSETPIQSTQSEGKKYCIAELKGNGKFQLLFERCYQDRRPFLLQYDLGKEKVAIDAYPSANIESLHLWTLKPVYELLSLNPLTVDLNTLLFKIPKKEKFSNKMLSAAQVQGLYDLQKLDVSQKLTIVQDDADSIFAYTPTLSYIQDGLFITSGNFSLQIYNIKDFQKGCDKSSKIIARESAKKDFIDTVTLPEGANFFLNLDMPSYHKGLEKAPLMGWVEIKPGKAGYFWDSYNNIGVRLRDIINNEGVTLFSDFAVKFKDNVIEFIDINRNVLTNPGTAIFLTQHASQRVIEDLEGAGVVIAKTIGNSIEKLGISIENASKSAGNAFIESSKNISEAMIYSANTLANTLNFATLQFNNAVKSLSLTAKEISADITQNTETIVRSLNSTAVLLNNALVDASENLEKASTNLQTGIVGASRNLKNAAKEISDSLKDSASSFNDAFKNLSDAIENGSSNIEDALERASKNFIKGMDKVKQAAEALHDTNHTVKVCLVS
ncbi:hypothetical protein [Candidatus Odyssella thessalonicensis]|uniref:hypothetical protein n=1 Tax=Candidatus Odyssella thessalonicensis TaxID=84647 RepID=UPI000225B491|nr:hypothetical protein [Candidatus Odyssella thessalonicensis]